jgi:mRNA interferase HigB
MRLHLIKEATIRDYVGDNSGSEVPFKEWLDKVKVEDWEMPEDIKKTFGSADILGKSTSRVVFDIGGNNYRMIGKYWFGEKEVHVFVKWIGTHAEYTKLCRKGKQYTISNY